MERFITPFPAPQRMNSIKNKMIRKGTIVESSDSESSSDEE